ncbi:MAG: CPBP family intramembrane metalloprotease [Chthoniobacterales bacterium]|nr:CPBP family intramembrane metalloprotease [Chthoniobacterales bacterium]
MSSAVQWWLGMGAWVGLIYTWIVFKPMIQGVFFRGMGRREVRWELPEVMAVVMLVCFLLLGFALGEQEEEKVTVDLIVRGILSYIFLLFFIFCWFWFRKKEVRDYLGLTFGKTKLLDYFKWVLGVLPPVMFTQFLVTIFVGKVEAQAAIRFLAENSGWWERMLILLLAGVIAPVVEEILFRGWIYGVARDYGGKFAAMVVTSLLFALIHDQAMYFWGLFVFGLMLVIIYEYTGSLWASVAVHSGFNMISVLLTILWPELVLGT